MTTTLQKLAIISSDLKDYHNSMQDDCPGSDNCQVLAIMAKVDALMTEIASADDAEFTAVATETMGATDVADAILRAKP